MDLNETVQADDLQYFLRKMRRSRADSTGAIPTTRPCAGPTERFAWIACLVGRSTRRPKVHGPGTAPRHKSAACVVQLAGARLHLLRLRATGRVPSASTYTRAPGRRLGDSHGECRINISDGRRLARAGHHTVQGGLSAFVRFRSFGRVVGGLSLPETAVHLAPTCPSYTRHQSYAKL